MNYVLYNPFSTSSFPPYELKSEMEKHLVGKSQFLDVTKIISKEDFFKSVAKDDGIIISGGDGTLNRLVNFLDLDECKNRIFLHKAGNGNDFLRDINELRDDFIEITQYLKHLPKVTLNGETSKYLNGVGFGVDGMVCVESDKLKAKGKKNINYTTLAIKLLLFKFKRVNASVTVDGKSYNFKHVYIGSAMNGKYYGGGMKEAPNQDRSSDLVSVVIWHNFNPLTGLISFPKIFTGEHVNNKKHITVLTGKDVTMTFSKPTDLQIDGESYHAVTSYHVVK